jgi:hypothetical protein
VASERWPRFSGRIKADVTLDAKSPDIRSIQETQEPQMTQRAMSLMDVLAPPGNDWLKELSRRKTDLPACVHIVRFGDGDDELADDGEVAGKKARHGQKLAA